MRLKIGSTYQKAVTIIEKLKEGNASIFICGKSGTGKTTLSSDIIIRNLLESGVRIVVIDHRHAVSLPADLCASSGRVSKATQAAFVWNISKSRRCLCIFR